jgi:hypothetical protein
LGDEKQSGMGYDIQPLTLELFPLAARYVPVDAVRNSFIGHVMISGECGVNPQYRAMAAFKYFPGLRFSVSLSFFPSQGTIPYHRYLFRLQNVSTI